MLCILRRELLSRALPSVCHKVQRPISIPLRLESAPIDTHAHALDRRAARCSSETSFYRSEQRAWRHHRSRHQHQQEHAIKFHDGSLYRSLQKAVPPASSGVKCLHLLTRRTPANWITLNANSSANHPKQPPALARDDPQNRPPINPIAPRHPYLAVDSAAPPRYLSGSRNAPFLDHDRQYS